MYSSLQYISKRRTIVRVHKHLLAFKYLSVIAWHEWKRKQTQQLYRTQYCNAPFFFFFYFWTLISISSAEMCNKDVKDILKKSQWCIWADDEDLAPPTPSFHGDVTTSSPMGHSVDIKGVCICPRACLCVYVVTICSIFYTYIVMFTVWTVTSHTQHYTSW